MPNSRVLVVGDPHCPGMRKDYVPFLKSIHKKHKCNRVVLIGDVVDNGAISYHERHPGMSAPQEEYKATLRQVATLYKAFPKADWMLGNHDVLTERQMVTAGLLPEWLRDYRDLWEVPGWKVHPRYAQLNIDGVLYQHGDAGKGGMYSAVKNAKEYFASVVQGHYHSQGGVWWHVNPQHRVFGMQVGCGMDHNILRFEYGRKMAAKPVLGCGVVLEGRHAIFEPMIL